MKTINKILYGAMFIMDTLAIIIFITEKNYTAIAWVLIALMWQGSCLIKDLILVKQEKLLDISIEIGKKLKEINEKVNNL